MISAETYRGSQLVERTIIDRDAQNVPRYRRWAASDLVTPLETRPATADETQALVRRDLLDNSDTLVARATTALTNNATFLATVAGRRTAIANGKATATTGQSATITTVAQAQTQIRSVWTVMTQIATALDDLNNAAEALTRQNDGVIRLLLGALDSITDS